jgi:hypothetical protein
MRFWQFLLWILAFIAVSCSDMLNLRPLDTIPEELAIRNESDLKSAILGCYDALQSDGYYGRGLLIFNEIGTDNAYNGGTIIEFGQINRYNALADNTYVEGIWAAPYLSINRCNNIIFHLNRLDNIPEEKKSLYLAEVLFIRALNYYNLTRLFKDVPLRLKPTYRASDFNLECSPQSAIYEQILIDLNFSDGKLLSSNPFYATDLAVKTLLAKVYLELADYSNAIFYANLVIGSTRQLLDSYANLFTNEGNEESIFELNYTELSTDKNRLAEYCFPSNLMGRYEIAPEASFLSSFEPDDCRKDLFPGTTPYCNKYEKIGSGDDNVYIFRLAELYLLRAEARALSLGSITLIQDDINEIRNRAGLDNITADTYPDLLRIIEDERRHEFAFEGHRWFDLVRTGRAAEVLGISPSKYYFPIPLSEVNTNDLIGK